MCIVILPVAKETLGLTLDSAIKLVHTSGFDGFKIIECSLLCLGFLKRRIFLIYIFVVPFSD